MEKIKIEKCKCGEEVTIHSNRIKKIMTGYGITCEKCKQGLNVNLRPNIKDVLYFTRAIETLIIQWNNRQTK